MSTVSKLDLDALLSIGLSKLAATPMDQIAPGAAPAGPAAGGAPPVDPATGAPMDPAMMGSAPPVDPATGAPMDPAMMGGAPPMDPAMAGGMPMDPAMMDPAMAGMPPQEDPLVKLIEGMAKDIKQIKAIVATLSDQMGVKIPTNDLLEAGEDAMDSAMQATTDGGGEKTSSVSYGYPAETPTNAMYASHPPEPPVQLIQPDNSIRAAELWARMQVGR